MRGGNDATLYLVGVLLGTVAAAVAWGRKEGMTTAECTKVCNDCAACNAANAKRPEPVGKGGWKKPVPPVGQSGWGTWTPTSQYEDAACSITGNDGACFEMAYHHCMPGARANENRVPDQIIGYRAGAMQQIFNATRTKCTLADGKPCFNHAPKNWTSVCVARPDKWGKGACKHVTPFAWRAWVPAHNETRRKTECTYPSSYVHAMFRGSTLQQDSLALVEAG